MRVKRGFKARRRRNRVLKLAKGYRGRRNRCYKRANDAVERAMMQSARGRRVRRRDFRSLWIARINAAARLSGVSYSRFINGLKKANVLISTLARGRTLGAHTGLANAPWKTPIVVS